MHLPNVVKIPNSAPLAAAVLAGSAESGEKTRFNSDFAALLETCRRASPNNIVAMPGNILPDDRQPLAVPATELAAADATAPNPPDRADMPTETASPLVPATPQTIARVPDEAEYTAATNTLENRAAPPAEADARQLATQVSLSESDIRRPTIATPPRPSHGGGQIALFLRPIADPQVDEKRPRAAPITSVVSMANSGASMPRDIQPVYSAAAIPESAAETATAMIERIANLPQGAGSDTEIDLHFEHDLFGEVAMHFEHKGEGVAVSLNAADARLLRIMDQANAQLQSLGEQFGMRPDRDASGSSAQHQNRNGGPPDGRPVSPTLSPTGGAKPPVSGIFA